MAVWKKVIVSGSAADLASLTLDTTLAVAEGGTGVTAKTGTTNLVLSNSPTLVTPALGTPSALVLTNATALPAAQVAQGTMASGMVLVAPALGTPASGVMTNTTGTSGITGLGTQTVDLEMGGFNIQTAGIITLKEQADADADVAGEGQLWVDTATPNVFYFTDDAGTDFRLNFSTSAQLRGMLSDETGTGGAVFATSPTLVTPALGTPASGTMTNVTGTSGITGLGTQTIDLEMGGFNIQNAGIISLKEQAEADSDVAGEGQLWVDTATPNVLYFTDDAGTDFRLSHTNTGTGNNVLATSPTLVTPALGTPASGVLTNCTALPAAQVAQGTMASGMVLVAPALGTPASGVMTNVTGTAASLTAGTATVATTVTITDNESTDEDNAVIFTAGGDVDGGNIGLESDGTLTYNPSTGKVTATGFIGTLTGNADTATLATTVTITDNESTNENNPLVFVAGADADGGNLGLESDGTTHYNPSTGTVTATEFVGGGGGLTGVAADIDGLDALSSVGNIHQTNDHFLISDAGTEKKITFSDLEDEIFGNFSGDIAVAAGGAVTLGTVEASHVTEISNLTAVEGAQLENIDSVTISNGQWAYVGGMDQDVKTSSDVTFADITATGDLTVTGTVTQQQVTNINIEDQFILLHSGSSATADSGIIFGGTSGTVSQGKALIWDASYNSNDGRLAVSSTDVAWNSTSAFGAGTAGYYVAGVFEGSLADAATAKADHAGNIRIESSDIYIYV